MPEWTYTGSKDETFSDFELDFNNGGDDDDGGNGDSGGNNGGDDGGDKAEEKEFGPLLKFDEVMKETERRGIAIALPEDMLEAAKSVGVRKLFLLRYLHLQVWFLCSFFWKIKMFCSFFGQR